ncbi:hypothetical protein ALC60_06983 [Trachymyrmex zeteki]|uniref:Uncharacterized protein n=1 Tax=Mycetomoellerius zeteki TaxID=64791 RepID=A0A151X136_9HYME|nr:hypothetical protein ALC60_06983 [Trachymyrmex zeteki]
MEPYSRRVTRDERRHGKRMSRSGEEEKRENGEKHEEAKRREVAIYASDSSFSEGTTTRCMPPNAAEEFLAIFLHVRGRLIAATAEINEQKEREKEREKNDTRSWLGNEANSIIERKRQIAPQNRKLIIELVHEDDPASPIYYAKHFGPGRRSVAETGSIAKKHPNELDHAKIKSEAFSKGSTRRRDIQRREAQDEEVGVNRYIDTGHFFLPINSQTTLAGLRI